jgi:hypothetical protein
MKNGLTNLVIFIAGAALGYFVARKIMEVQEAINSINEDVSSVADAESENDEANLARSRANKSKDKPDIRNYARYALNPTPKKETNIRKPYVIPPEEFGERDDYERITLLYYSDNVLTDEDDDPIEEDQVGIDSLTHFGEYEDDSVFVRNDEMRCDFEILKCLETYEEVAARKRPRRPHEEI